MHIAIIVILVLLGVIAFTLPSKPIVIEEQSNVDAFQPTADPAQDILDYLPNQPSPVDLQNSQPYHLLSDIMGEPRVKESVSCVNSRSCYATNFERTIEKTGNYNQLTNNYKRKYPDSCSSPLQELVLNFYKV
jgi:hypothetical protein